MTIESQRKRLQTTTRQWGDRVPVVPYTAVCPPNNARENFDSSAAQAAPPIDSDSGSDSDDDVPLAGDLDQTYLQIPITPNTTMISTKGWTLDSLINQSLNFHHAPRVSALSNDLPQVIHEHEQSGLPLVIYACHKHPNWPKDEFTLDSFASASSDKITVRNVHDYQETIIPLSEFITKSRSIASFAEEGEQERFYAKDIQCPRRWEEWLRNGDVVPQSLINGGPQDLFRYRPESSRVETLMCYLGVGDTFTPCHKDSCASSGQNLMCHTEDNGSSFWFMTESANALKVADFFHTLGRELDHEDYVITVEELSKAPFKVYIIEQKLGDLVLVPPRSAHQVVNFGGITVKTSWSRMTLKGLVTAYHHELPVYRRVCRPETYRVKSTIHDVLLGLINDFRSLQNTNAPNSSNQDREKQLEFLVSNIWELRVVFDRILAEEESNASTDETSPNEANSTAEEIVCDCCGADIFQSFFECSTCVEADSAEGGYVVCGGCFAEGRSCKCEIMRPMQRRSFKSLLATREEAIQVVDEYERHRGKTFQPSNDYCDTNDDNYPRIFRAALVLLDMRKKMKPIKMCRHVTSHLVPFPWALHCKLCHHSKCFSHILTEHRTHSVEALLLHNSDNTHKKYHYHHTVTRKARFEINATKVVDSPLGYQQLVLYAINFSYCKPVKPQLMKLGWYDMNSHSSYVSDDQESPSQAEMVPTLVPAISVSTESASISIAIEPPAGSISNLTVKLKRTLKRKAYVLVPEAPYPTSALFLTPREPQPIVNKSEQRVLLPLQENCKVPESRTIAKLPTLSEIGISIPTTVRRPGSFIVHSIIPGNPPIAEEAPSIKRPVKPTTTRTSKRTGNCVTGQVITKASIAKLKFNKSKTSQPKPTVVASTSTQPEVQPAPPPMEPSETTNISLSTQLDSVAASIQEEGLKTSLPESQLVPPVMEPSGTTNSTQLDSAAVGIQGEDLKVSLPESQPVPPATELSETNVFSSIQIFVTGFICELFSRLSQQNLNLGQSMNPLHMPSSSGPQTSHGYNSHPQQQSDRPPQHNSLYDQPPQYNGAYDQPLHKGAYDQPSRFNGSPRSPRYGPPQQHNSPTQLSGPTQLYGPSPHHVPPQHFGPPSCSSYYSSHEHSSHPHASHGYNGHPQQQSDRPPQHNGAYDQPSRLNGSPRSPRYGSPRQYIGPTQFYGPSYHLPSQHFGPPSCSSYYKSNSHPHVRYNNLHPPSYPTANQLKFHQGKRRPLHHQPLVQSAGKTRYMNRQPPDEYNPHHNGRNEIAGNSASSKQHSHKKRKLNGPQDSHLQSQTRYPNIRGSGAQPPQGPRGHKFYARRRVEHHDGIERSTSRDQRSSWGTSGEGQQYGLDTETNHPQSHDPSIEPKMEESTPRFNFDYTMDDDITDADSADIPPLDIPLPMPTPTFATPPTTQDGLHPEDSVMDTNDVLHEAGTPPVNDPPENDQNWEDNYAIEERVTHEESAAPQLPPATTAALDSMFDVADESMADVTMNPWTS